MTEQRALITIPCPKCNGSGRFLYSRLKNTFLLRCKKCRGAGHIRKEIALPKAKPIPTAPVVVKSIKEIRRSSKERVERFRKAHPERWNEIQNKYRRKSERFKKYFREYLVEYRAKKAVEYPKERVRIGRPKVAKDKMCIKCKKFRQKPWGKGLCVWCIAKMRKDLMDRGSKINRENVMKLRDVDKMTFSEIGRIYGVSRQRAYQKYVEMKSPLTSSL